MNNNNKKFQVKGRISFDDDEEVSEATFHLLIPSLGIDKEIKWELDLTGGADLSISKESVDYLKSVYSGMHVGVQKDCFDDNYEIETIYGSFDVYVKGADNDRFNIVFLDDKKENFKPMAAALEDFSKLFNDQKFTDVTVRCNGGELKSHKAILCARSVVFEKMFSSDTLESKTGIIECNFELEVMKNLLEYVYSDRVSVNLLKAKESYEAADYYQIPSLMGICVNFLKNNLNSKNAKEIIDFAEKFNVETLKEATSIYTKKSASVKKRKLN